MFNMNFVYLCMNKIENQRLYRKANNNACTKKYEKTKSGFLMRLYRNMTSRVKGIQRAKSHLYKGLEILPKKDFYEWANKCDNFHAMFKTWEDSGYDRRLCPTVDRIDSNLGYIVVNMQWLTHSENSSKSSRNKRIFKDIVM